MPVADEWLVEIVVLRKSATYPANCTGKMMCPLQGDGYGPAVQQAKHKNGRERIAGAYRITDIRDGIGYRRYRFRGICQPPGSRFTTSYKHAAQLVALDQRFGLSLGGYFIDIEQLSYSLKLAVISLDDIRVLQ